MTLLDAVTEAARAALSGAAWCDTPD